MDDVKREKRKAVERFNRLRILVRFWQVFQILVGLGMVSWSSAHVPAVLKTIGGCFLEISAYLFNHHVVFFLGNAIIVTLYVLCRQNGDLNISAGCGDLYDDYVKCAEAIHQREPALAQSPDNEADGGEKKQITVCIEEKEAVTECDEVTEAIENATKLINKFQKVQSEKLKREIGVRTPDLRKLETENLRKTVNNARSSETAGAEIENLSSEEFRSRVDAFINKHWCATPTTRNQFTGENYRLLKIS